VRLRGDAWNPFGYGAIVKVVTDDGMYIRQMNDAFNFRSQSGPGLVHLGLGDSKTARIRVVWPDGSVDCAIAVAGVPLEISIGSTTCKV
jgi:hypothetical protein